MPGWVLLSAALAYSALLFAIAWYGDRRPLYPSHAWLRPIVYSLALAVFCTSWTFYGAVGTAATAGLAYVPIYLGPILVFVVFGRFIQRLVAVAKRQQATSIADFIAARFGRSQGLAALVTLIGLVAAVPYVALQFKAVAMGVGVLTGEPTGPGTPWYLDTALYVALLMALFAILFGTRAVDATEHHHGLMLAVAVESVVKLAAFVAVGLFALRVLDAEAAASVARLPPLDPGDALTLSFATQTLLAAAAIVCLPRQFQVGVVECEDPRDVGHARWAFPLYLAVFTLTVLPIAAAGLAGAGPDVHPDTYVLSLPAARGEDTLALLAFLGGYSAATGMVIVVSVALATMISNELVLPALSRLGALRLGERGDLSRLVLWIRRIAILLLAAMAFAYYRRAQVAPTLASVGLLAFAAVAQFAPALIGGLLIRGLSRDAAIAGMAVGFAVWLYTLFLPSVSGAGLLPGEWLAAGPGGLTGLAPQALFGLRGLDPLTHGALWSLGANVLTCVVVSRWRPPTMQERLRARQFVAASEPDAGRGDGALAGRMRVGDLVELAGRIVGARAAQSALAEYAARRGRTVTAEEAVDRGLAQHIERLLAAALGATSARLVLTSALRGRGMDVDEVATLLDETSQELRFNRELLQATMENVAQGISVVDAELRLVAWNRRYLELFDYPDGMVHVGRPVADLIRWNARRGEWGPGDPEEHVRKRLAHLARGTPYVFQRVRADGTVLEMRGQPMPGGGFVTSYADVTAYKRVEQALRALTAELEQRVAERTAELERAVEAQRAAKQEAEAANLSKTRFLAAASHDLLQPLNAARLFTSALRHDPAIGDPIARQVQRIDSSLAAAEELLSALLDVARLERGALQPVREPVSLRLMFHQLDEQFAPVAEQRGLRWRSRTPDLWVDSDRQLLRRVLQNLLSNALRYTRTGGVLLAARVRGAEIALEVWDTGPGIAEAHRELIFQEFQRLDGSAAGPEQGLGLGLAIVERATRALGHGLALRSRPGRGSVFSIRAPRVPAPEPAEAGQTAHASGPFAGLRVLCLDNDPAVLDGMAALLRRWDCRVLLARDREAALAALAQEPQVLLADYHLDAGDDGLAAIRALRARAPGLAAALVTADRSEELRAAARDDGVAVLAKPVKPAALRALLDALRPAATEPPCP